MIRNDFIMRQIQLLGEFLRRIMIGMETDDIPAARMEIANASQSLLGLHSATLIALPPDQTTTLLTTGGEPDPGKFLIAGKLLSSSARASRMEGDELEAFAVGCRALYFLLQGHQAGDAEFSVAFSEAISEELASLAAYEMPDFINFLLIDFYQKQGEFASAENVVFDLLQRGVQGAKERGERFYATLASLSDETLAAGGLPREELEQSVEDLRAQTTPSDRT